MSKSKPIIIARCDAKLLSDAAAHVNAAIDKRTTVPILSCLLLETVGDRLHLTGTNHDVEAGEEVAAEILARAAVRLAVEGVAFQQVLARMKGEVSLAMTEKPLQLIVSCGRAVAELGALPGSDFQRYDREGDDCVDFQLASGQLATGLGSVEHCQSAEQTRPYLNGVHIQDTGAHLLFTATDGHRLAALRQVVDAGAREGGQGKAPEAIVPRRAVAEIVKFCNWADGPVDCCIGERVFEVSAKGRYFAARLIDGQFPDYERVIPKSNDRHLKVSAKELGDAVGLVISVSNERSRAVKLETGADFVRVSARGDQHAATAAVDLDPASEPGDPGFEFGCNANYLLQALAAAGKDDVTLSLGDPMTPVLIHTGDELRQVIMPLRI